MRVTVARCWFIANRPAVGTFVDVHLLVDVAIKAIPHTYVSTYAKTKRVTLTPTSFMECTDISHFWTHMMSSLKHFYQIIKIHKIEKSLLRSQYFNHPNKSRTTMCGFHCEAKGASKIIKIEIKNLSSSLSYQMWWDVPLFMPFSIQILSRWRWW